MIAIISFCKSLFKKRDLLGIPPVGDPGLGQSPQDYLSSVGDPELGQSQQDYLSSVGDPV